MAVRALIFIFITVLLALQVRLWISDDGYREVRRLERQIAEQRAENALLIERNARLEAEVDDLQKGSAAIEERARADLGLVGKDEDFYLFTEPGTAAESEQ